MLELGTFKENVKCEPQEFGLKKGEVSFSLKRAELTSGFNLFAAKRGAG